MAERLRVPADIRQQDPATRIYGQNEPSDPGHPDKNLRYILMSVYQSVNGQRILVESDRAGGAGELYHSTIGEMRIGDTCCELV